MKLKILNVPDQILELIKPSAEQLRKKVWGMGGWMDGWMGGSKSEFKD